MRATGIGNLGNKRIRYTPDMILTFLLAHANYDRRDEKMEFIYERHPELRSQLNIKNFQEMTTRHGWYKTAMKMKNDALKIAADNARTRKAELTTNALDKELDMVSDLEAERENILSEMKMLPKSSREYSSLTSSLARVTDMIARITDTDRIRRREDLIDRADVAIYVAEKRDALKDPTTPVIGEHSEMITEDEADSFSMSE